MSIENITVANTSGGTSTSLTFAHNHTAGNFLVVFVGTRYSPNISVTYGGTSMSSEAAVVTATEVKKECFTLENPISGSNNVVVNLSTAYRFSIFAISLSDIDSVRDVQTASDTITAAPFEIGMDVPSSSGDVVLTSYHWRASAADIDSVSINETLEAEDTVNSQPSRGVLTSKTGLTTETPTKVVFDGVPDDLAGVGISLVVADSDPPLERPRVLERKANRKVLVQKDVNGNILAYGSVAIEQFPDIEVLRENETYLILHDTTADVKQLMERKVTPAELAQKTAHNFRQASVVNSNGTAIRYRDGLQMCTVTIAAGGSDAPNNASGNIYRSDEVTWTYPAKFFKVFSVGGQCLDSGCWVGVGTPTVTSVTYRELSPTSTTAKGVKLTAWGTWK